MNKMKKLIPIIIMLCINIIAEAQIKTYKGTVTDPKGNAIPFANVVLYTLPDSTFVAGSVTNDLGEFIIESTKKLSKGYIEISCIGYESKTITPKVNVGVVVMNEDAKQLGEVVVKGSEPVIKNQNGRLIFNVKNTPLRKDYSANDLLIRTPSVTMSGNGIAVAGGGAELRINGVKQNLKGAALTAFLNGLKSDQIKQIEVQSGRTADIDANLSGGIVNIVVEEKRGLKVFVDSKLNYNGKSYHKDAQHLYNGTGGAGITFGTKKTQLYANIYGGGGRFHGVKSESDYLIKQVNKLISEKSVSKYIPSKYIDINSGLSYKLNKTNIINFEGSVNKTPTKKILKNSNIRLSQEGTFTDSLFINSLLKSENTQYAFTASHRWQSLSKKCNLNTQFNYLHNKQEEQQNVESKYLSQISDNLNDTNKTESNSSMFYAQTKLNYTFENGINTIAGIKYTHTKRKSDYLFSSDNSNSFNTLYEFTEQLPAAFVNLDKKLSNGIFISLGLRGEYTNLKSENSAVELNYFDLFPSFLVSYKLKNNLALKFNYAKSIWRPSFSLLNNYKVKISDYLYSIGNPEIKAQKTDYFKIGLSKKGHYLNVSYSYSSNPISESIYTENNIVFIKNINAGEEHKLSLNYSYSGNIIPMWYLSANTGASYINLPDSRYKKEIYQAYISVYNNLKLSKKIRCNINAKYATPWIMNDRKIDDRFSLDIDMKYALNKNFTISAGVKNLLRKSDKTSITDNIYTHYNHWRETAFRVYSISFSYNFSKGEKIKNRKIRNENKDRYRL